MSVCNVRFFLFRSHWQGVDEEKCNENYEDITEATDDDDAGELSVM